MTHAAALALIESQLVVRDRRTRLWVAGDGTVLDRRMVKTLIDAELVEATGSYLTVTNGPVATVGK